MILKEVPQSEYQDLAGFADSNGDFRGVSLFPATHFRLTQQNPNTI